MADDTKYGRVVAERKDFHENEPVFVLRAQDALAPYAVDMYAMLLRAAALAIDNSWDQDEIEQMADEIENIAAAMRVWQGANPSVVKFPD